MGGKTKGYMVHGVARAIPNLVLCHLGEQIIVLVGKCVVVAESLDREQADDARRDHLAHRPRALVRVEGNGLGVARIAKRVAKRRWDPPSPTEDDQHAREEQPTEHLRLGVGRVSVVRLTLLG